MTRSGLRAFDAEDLASSDMPGLIAARNNSVTIFAGWVRKWIVGILRPLWIIRYIKLV
jgi:hypothetical protein